MLIGGVVGLVLGAAPLRGWSETIPEGYGVQEIAEAWRAVAFGGPYRQLRAWVRAVEALRF